MPTYSVQLFSVISTSSPVAVYTAPATGTIVVRDLEVCNQSGATDAINIFVSGVPGSSATFIYHASAQPQGTMLHWDGRVVLLPGQAIEVYSGAPGWTVLGSGYNLS